MEPSDPTSEPHASAATAAHARRRALRATAAAMGLAVTLCAAPPADAAAGIFAGFAVPTPISLFDWLLKGPDGNPPWSTDTATYPPGNDAVPQVLSLINRARAQAALPAYTITAGLTRSAGSHNQAMVDGCGLSHQCAGENGLGTRESAAEVRWTSAGENVGDGGPVADSAAAVAQMAAGLTQRMLDEAPGDDGHRRNILSKSFHHIGIAVYRDGSGTVWMTQDFSN